MRSRTITLAIALFAASPFVRARPLAAQQRDSLTITFLANMGVMLTSAGTTVLIDGLFGEGLRGYGVVTPQRRAQLQRAAPPFDSVDVVLATHVHGDHFDPAAVLQFLRANPRATFVASTQAAGRLRDTDSVAWRAVAARVVPVEPAKGQARRVGSTPGVTIEALGLPHGRTRNPATNVGFLIQLGGRRILHPGDAEFAASDVARLGLAGRRVDVALLPQWYLTSSAQRAVVRQLRPTMIIALHVAPDEREEFLRDTRKDFPNLRVFAREMETIVVR